jgi:hypothetical protein
LSIPILYLSQAVGLSVGLEKKELGILRHFVKVDLPEKKAEVKEVKEVKTAVKKEEITEN